MTETIGCEPCQQKRRVHHSGARPHDRSATGCATEIEKKAKGERGQLASTKNSRLQFQAEGGTPGHADPHQVNSIGCVIHDRVRKSISHRLRSYPDVIQGRGLIRCALSG